MISLRFLADTNALAAAVIEDHVHHVPAREKFQEAKEVYMTHASVTELAYLFWKLGVESYILFEILSHPKIKLVSVDKAVVLSAKKVSDERLSLSHFVDLIIVYTALLIGLPLFTFDKKLRKRAEQMGVELV